jgi:signal transduction histidine kinase
MKLGINLKVRTNLVLLFTILFWSLSVILYVFIPSRVEEFALSLQIGEARNMAALLSANLAPFAESNSKDSLRMMLDQIPERYDLHSAVITDSQGRNFVENAVPYDANRFHQSISSLSTWTSDDGLMLHIQSPLPIRRHERRFLLADFSLTGVRQEVQGIRITIAVTCAVMYLIGLTIILGIASVITRPFRTMAAISDQIRAETGEKTTSAGGKSPKKTSSLNEIIDAMEFARATMENINNQLEHRIDVRTRQLVNEIENRRQIEEQLHKLSMRLQSVREEERAWIAREIHDELGQALTGLKMYITGIIYALKDTSDRGMAERLGDKLQSMASLVDTTMSSIQKIVAELRPPILDKVGLVAGIEWHINQFIERTNIHCEFNSDLEDKDIPSDFATPLFRIAQETMTNVARHANASEIIINLGRSEGCIILKIQDNGKGITEEEIHSMNSLGLLGMRERISPLHGEVFVSGKPGRGTTVIVRVPLAYAGGEHDLNENLLVS